MASEVLFYALALLSLFSGLSGQASLQIEGSDQQRMVNESVGTTEICVSLSNAMPGDSSTFAIQTFSSASNSELYFEALNDVIRTLNNTLTRTCVDLRIVQNGIETGNTEVIVIVSLAHNDATGTLTASSANNARRLFIDIQDTDEVEVGFNRAGYQVTEGNPVRICVDLNNGRILPGVDVELVHAFTPAMANGLQTGSMTFRLSNTSLQSCIDFPTGSVDSFIDSNRVQTATLMSGDIAVRFSRNSSTVEIIDASVATLAIVNITSLEMFEGGFNTTTVVTICLDLISVEGGLRRDIVVNITENGTATVANDDYSAPITTLTIPRGTTVAGFMSSDYCVNVTIIGDDVRELNETILLTFDASPDVFEGPDNVTITILDDGDVNDCTMLLTPANGRLELNGTELGSVAQYSCNEKFRLMPQSSSIRTCGPDNWDGVEPQCVIICELQDLPNGAVYVPKDIDFITEGTTVSHSCIANYRLQGNEFRMCQSDGTWSGSLPSCIAVTCPMLGSPANGGVSHSGTSVGTTATYSCFTNFMLVGGGAGGGRRVCLSDGTWSGSEPTCNGAIRTVPSGVTLLLALVSLFSIIIHTCI